MKILFLLFLITLSISSCQNNSANDTTSSGIKNDEIPTINYSVVNMYLHDTALFTEGFVFYDGKIYESSGSPDNISYTNSVVGIDNLQTGKFDKIFSIDKKIFFGEGIVFLNNKLYLLTYTNQVGFIYEAKSFKKIGSFNIPTKEGWGMTTDGKYLIMDDGSCNLIYIDPNTFKQTKALTVTRYGMRQDSLNELEYIKGYIYANIWYRNEIVKIDTGNGKIVGTIDVSSVVAEAKMRHPNADVLNGIAYDSINDKIYITGKLWQNIYEIKFSH